MTLLQSCGAHVFCVRAMRCLLTGVRLPSWALSVSGSGVSRATGLHEGGANTSPARLLQPCAASAWQCTIRGLLHGRLSSSRAAVACRDLQTGSHLAAFKSSGGPCRGCACLGSDAFVCAQQGKDSLHFYAWHQEALLQRCFVAERLLCVAAAHVGSVVAAGAASGFLYVWNTSSGRLLATQKAHTRSVTCVAVDDSGALLFTGGQDCLVSCWWLTELLDTAAAGATQPKWTGCAHTPRLRKPCTSYPQDVTMMQSRHRCVVALLTRVNQLHESAARQNAC